MEESLPCQNFLQLQCPAVDTYSLKIFNRARRRTNIVRANLLANVAAENPVPDSRPERFRDRPAILNCQVRNTTPGVDGVLFSDGACRALVDAAPAAAALQLKAVVIRLKLERGQHDREKEP